MIPLAKKKGGKTQHNLLSGALILMVSTVMVKIIGAIFKIPLGNLIGMTGMGYYSAAYDIYTPIYTIAMAGLPIAVSKLVAEAVAQERFRDARSLLRVAKKTFFVTGLVGFLLIAVVAFPFTNYVTKSPESMYSMLVVAPSMLFCCVMSCYRGYYEGVRNMNPTAISQVIEALGKLIFGLLIAYIIIKIGISEFLSSGTVFGTAITEPGQTVNNVFLGQVQENVFNATLPFAAAGAIGGVTLGTIIGAIFLVLRDRVCGDGITQEELERSAPALPDRENFKKLMLFALPVVLGALAQNLASLIDLATVQNKLASAMEIGRDTLIASHGSALLSVPDSDIASNLYGCYKGGAYSFYNLIPTITSMIGISALPNLATAWAQNDRRMIKFNIESVLRVVSIIALPVGLGISALSGEILTLFYPHNAQVPIMSELLFWLAISGVLAGVAMPVTSMLQAIGKQKIPVVTVLIGMGIKIVLNWVLVGIPEINIMGAAYSTVACYAVIVTLNIIALVRNSGVMPSIWKTLGKPVIAGVLCMITAMVSASLLTAVVGSLIVKLAISVILAAFVYIFVLFALKTLTKEDINLLPKGEKIAKVLEKLKLLG